LQFRKTPEILFFYFPEDILKTGGPPSPPPPPPSPLRIAYDYLQQGFQSPMVTPTLLKREG